MQRVTVSIDDDLLDALDALVGAHGYQNRSEALRDLLREGLGRTEPADPAASCTAALVYVYDHARRELPRRLTGEAHDHHELGVATLHVHLDSHSCLEVAVLKGARGAVQHMADHVIAERGVRHGQLVMLPAEADEEA